MRPHRLGKAGHLGGAYVALSVSRTARPHIAHMLVGRRLPEDNPIVLSTGAVQCIVSPKGLLPFRLFAEEESTRPR